MSATPNNAGPGWENARVALPRTAPDSREADGRNALQGLLAFACIHQQAARRRREAQNFPTDASQRFSREEEFALDEILQLVAARAIAMTGADGVAIALAKDRAIVCRASAGKIAPDPGAKLDPNAGFSGACLRTGEIVRCDDSENDPRVNAQACRALGTRSMIAVPLSARRRVIGLLEAFSTEQNGFNDSDVRSLSLLGELILSAIRPEEEHHLAEMARELLPDTSRTPSSPLPAVVPPPPITSTSGAGELAPQSTAKPVSAPNILVDEKFAPSKAPSTASRISIPQKPEVLKPAVAPCPVPSEPAAETLPRKLEPPTIALPSPAPSAVSPLEIHPPIASTLELGAAPRERSFLSMVLTATAVMVAIGLAVVLVWRWHHVGQAFSTNAQAASEIKPAEAQSPIAEPAPPAPALKIGATAQVTGIHHFSDANSSTIVIDLEDQVQYEEHQLDNPPRIYFDLHDTKLIANLANQTINIDDGFLKRVRVAQPVEGITRVVLETKNQSEAPSVSLDTNPYRLTIQVHKPGAAPAAVPIIKPQPLLPKPSPAVSITPKKASTEAQPATDNLAIVLDAGHGGWDLGTVGRKGLLEKDLVIDIVQRLGTLLETRLGASVVFTRQDDSYLSLEKRAEIANLAKANLFLSVHANYSDLSTARGVETYYTNTYSSIKARTADGPPLLQQVNWSGVVDIRAKVTESRHLASDVQQALYGGLATRNPDIRNRGVKEAQYVVLTGTQMPAVLAEVSFVSSPGDEDRLQNSEYRQMIAEALFKGVARYRDETRRTKLAKLQKPSR